MYPWVPGARPGPPSCPKPTGKMNSQSPKAYEFPEPKEYKFPGPKAYEFPKPKVYEFPVQQLRILITAAKNPITAAKNTITAAKKTITAAKNAITAAIIFDSSFLPTRRSVLDVPLGPWGPPWAPLLPTAQRENEFPEPKAYEFPEPKEYEFPGPKT